MLVIVEDYSLPFLEKVDDFHKSKQLLACGHSTDVEKTTKTFPKSSTFLTALVNTEHIIITVYKNYANFFMCAFLI